MPDRAHATSTTESVAAWASAVLPALWGASRAPAFAPAAADLAVLRDVGLANLGVARAVDAWWSALFRLLPVGSGSARASFASAVAAGVAGRLLYALARLLVRAREERSSRLAPFIALIAATTATLGLPWQHASTSPGGAMLAALLVLAPPLVIASDRVARDVRMPLALGLTALAVGRDLGTASMALPAVIASMAIHRRFTDLHLSKWTNGVFLLVAALPPVEATLRAMRSTSILSANLSWRSLAPDSTPATPDAMFALLDANGALPLLLSLLGAAALLATPRRRTALFTALSLLLPALVVRALCPGTDTADAALVVQAGVASALLAPALYVAVQAVRWTNDRSDLHRGPQATLLLLAEAVLPVHAADEGFAPVPTTDQGAFFALAAIDLPPHPVVLLHDPATFVRLQALAARGEARPDAILVPTFALASRTEETAHAWQSEPKLLPLYSDMVLRNTPDEASLSALATARHVVVDADPTWDAPLVRHTTPRGVLEDFHPESRGPSDRLRALDAWPMIGCTSTAADHDDTDLVVAMLDRRLAALGKIGERDVVQRVMQAMNNCPRASPSSARQPLPPPLPAAKSR